MDIIRGFISDYGTAILYTILTAIAGYLGVAVKNIYQKYANDKTKKQVAETVVVAVEQLYDDLDGEEKLTKALEAMSQMLEEKGITISDIEMRMLIEAAVGSFNDAFNSTGSATLILESTETDSKAEIMTEAG